MKFLSLIVCSSIVGCTYGQLWRDSLQAARKFYFGKQYDRAANAYQYADKALKGKADISAEKAQNAFRNNNYNTAINLYQKRLKQSKGIAEKVQCHYNIGNAYFKQRRYKEAIRSYKNALRADPFNDQVRYNLSQALRKLQQSKNKQKPKDQKNQKSDRKDNKQDQEKKQKDSPKKDGSRKKNNTQKEEKRNKNTIGKNASDRILDKLLKDEVATKRKLNNARLKRKGTPKTSEYDW